MVCERLDDELVQPLSALAAAEDEKHGTLRRQPEERARLVARPRLRTLRDRPARDAVFRTRRPSTGNDRKTRRANGTASRFASPRCASASVRPAGIRFSQAE